MKTSEKIISAALTIVLGILCIIMKGGVISVAMTILGAVLIVLGILDLAGKAFPPAVVKIVLGVLFIVFGWTIVSAVLYIVAALLMITGYCSFTAASVSRSKGLGPSIP